MPVALILTRKYMRSTDQKHYTLDLLQSGHPQLEVGAKTTVQHIRVQVPQGLVAKPHLSNIKFHFIKLKRVYFEDHSLENVLT